MIYDFYPLTTVTHLNIWRELGGKGFRFVDLVFLTSLDHTMAKVQVTNVTVLDNPTAFQNPFQFEITFECVEELTTGWGVARV